MVWSTDLFDWLVTNWLSILSIAISILAGIFVSRYFFYKKSKIPSYSVRSIAIVKRLGSKPESLQILYASRQIDNLTATKLIFWNAGRDTIRSEDIADSEPITVSVREGCKIVDARVLRSNEKANRFTIATASDQSHFDIQFRYMDKGQGAVIQLLHTGSSSKDIQVHGKIMGAGSPIRKSIPNLEEVSLMPFLGLLAAKKHQGLALAVVLLFPVLVTLLLFIFPYPTDVAQRQILSIIASIMFLGLYWGTALYFTLNKRLPKGLEAFWED